MTQNRCGALTQYISLSHLLYQSLRRLLALFSIITLDFKEKRETRILEITTHQTMHM